MKDAEALTAAFTGVSGVFVLTLTPYDFWRRSHAHHHANSGNLDHRGFGDVDTLTVPEFLALPRWRPLLHRLYHRLYRS
jgi:fatty acid desaturase